MKTKKRRWRDSEEEKKSFFLEDRAQRGQTWKIKDKIKIDKYKYNPPKIKPFLSYNRFTLFLSMFVLKDFCVLFN